MAIPGLTACIYLDHNLHARLASDLRWRGFDAVTAQEAGLARATDEEQLAYAAGAGRVLLTYDVGDFAELAERWFFAGRHHSGIVIADELRGTRYGELLARVLRLLNSVTADECRDVVRRLEDFAA